MGSNNGRPAAHPASPSSNLHPETRNKNRRSRGARMRHFRLQNNCPLTPRFAPLHSACMSKPPAHPWIRLRGVRQNNLKNFDLDLPLNQLIAVTGLSGSGKSSLAFDTLFAEGQRRYIETFSPYARQFFDRMDKPRVDSIEGIPPSIAIEQRNAVRTTRSTVGTMTEICDYLKVLWPRIAQLHCRQCGRLVRKDAPQQIWETEMNAARGSRGSKAGAPDVELLVTFDLPLTDKLTLEESLGLITKQGYQRLLVPSGNPPSQSGITKNVALELNEVAVPWGTASTIDAPGPSPLRERSGIAKAPAGRLPPVLEQGPPPETDFRAEHLEVVRIDEAVARLKELKSEFLTVVQDRLALTAMNRVRFVEACEQAYHFGKGKLALHFISADSVSSRRHHYSNRIHCAECNIDYSEPSPALFSFNHPLGACPACRGFGRIIRIDYDLALPNRAKTLAEGVVKPWLTGHGLESQRDLMKFCRIRKVPVDVPFERLPKPAQDWVIDGDPHYGRDSDHEWPRAWYGVKGYFRWLESKAYKMHVRVMLSRYRAYTPCPDCHGNRLNPEALLYKVRHAAGGTRTQPVGESAEESATVGNKYCDLTLADFYQLPVRESLRFVEQIAAKHSSNPSDPVRLALNEVRARIGYLVEVGLGYLTLDRATRTLSGGETERVSLTTCLGTRLVNTLYILDEPSVGLHPRDTGRLVKILEQLRDLGNTVIVVEHEASVIRAADRIVDLGPGHGEAGGQLVFQGTCAELLKSRDSLTGQYLSDRKQIEIPRRRPVVPASVPRVASTPQESGATGAFPSLTIAHAALHNLQDVTVSIPLGRFVCLTGVSGSGKTTLMREVLLPALETRLKSRAAYSGPEARRADSVSSEDDAPDLTDRASKSAAITGWESLGSVVLVDQSTLGKTPRSNPAVYIGAFDDIRKFFSQTEAAKRRGLNASAFSFNSSQGQCERCRGAGFEKIEMQFLSDVFIRCPDCDGRRYRPHILEVKCELKRPALKPEKRRGSSAAPRASRVAWSIADLLDATVDEAVECLSTLSDSRPARRAVEKLRLLQEVGLGYLRLGQPINTLSGGESQRLKLVSHLAESTAGVSPANEGAGSDRRDACATLFLFDEPTTGLHFDDVRVLLKVFQRLVDAGHSVIVIEHNLDVIKCADWVIDLGPEAGDEGGQIVAQGTPEDIAACEASHTGGFVRELLKASSRNPLPLATPTAHGKN